MDCLSLPTPPSACPIFPISDRNRFVSAVTLILIDCLPATLIDSFPSVDLILTLGEAPPA